MSKNIVTDWTYDHLVKQYADFLVICLHTICYYRNLYDRAYFSLARVYNCPVQRCKHPLLTEYINSVVSAVAEELRKCRVERIAVVILGSQDVALERFVFDVSTLPKVAPEDLHTPFRDTTYQAGQLDGQFRAAIMKLQLIETKLGPVPDDCTFGVHIELRQGHDQKPMDAWVEAEEQLTANAPGKINVPLRRIAFGPILLDSWVEETRSKLKLPESGTTAGSHKGDLSF